MEESLTPPTALQGVGAQSAEGFRGDRPEDGPLPKTGEPVAIEGRSRLRYPILMQDHNKPETLIEARWDPCRTLVGDEL